MKQFVLFAVAALLCVSCKKEKDDNGQTTQPPSGVSFEKDASYGDQTTESPRTNIKGGLFKLSVGKTNRFDIGYVSVTLQGASTLNVTSAIKNLRLTIRDGKDSSQVFQKTISSPTSGENSFEVKKLYLPDNRNYSFEIVYDAVDQQLSNKVTASVDVAYYYEGLTTRTTGAATGQTVTFSKATLSASLSGNTPKRQKVVANQEIPTLTFIISPKSIASINEVRVQVPNATGIESVAIVHGSTAIGSASFVGNTALVKTTLSLSDTVSKELTCVLKLRPITSAAQSNVSIKTSVTQLSYTTSGGNTNSLTTTISGNDIYVYKAIPQFGYGAYSNIITNNQFEPIFAGTINAIGEGSTGHKQFGIDLKLQDNPVNDSALRVDSLVCYVDDVPIAARFTNAGGQQITKLVETDTRLYVTIVNGVGQEISVPVNAGVKNIVVKGIRRGFNQSDGDLMTAKWAWDTEVLPIDYRYVNQGTTGLHAKLFNSLGPSSSAKVVAQLWSDHSDPQSSAAFGASTIDHYSSEGLDAAQGTETFYRTMRTR